DPIGSRKTKRRREEVRRPDRLFRRIAPRMIETQRALQRHPPSRPLILPIEGGVPDAITLGEDPEALSERARLAVQECVGQVQIVTVVLNVFDEVTADVSEL